MSFSVPQPVTFIRFPKLPTELRLMIWELALDWPRHAVHVYPVEDDPSSNGPDPKLIGRATLNFILEREYALCMRHKGETTSEYEENGKDRGMWRACKESREIVKRNTKGPFKSHFDNPLTARLTSVLNADIIHLVRVPYLLDEVVTMGTKPGQNPYRKAVWRFADWFAPLVGRVFLIDYNLKRSIPIGPGASVPDVIFEENGRRFVKVRMDGAGWENVDPGQGNQRVRYLIPDIVLDSTLLPASMYRSMTDGLRLENCEGVGCIGGHILSQE
ncbi:hypothetical protein FPHYL_3905 [Fusarium phyllophilum]|uniref:2EXR domain-containing protein n=1 Tax=Fusarium phyllophilum TaxID=47803 RepID=A0A8H5K2L4_9HYPO|nr:hypothetical protein FPHYL_3905 [Fusarium phyllophilum]